MIRLLVLTICVLLISGCGKFTTSDMRSSPAHISQFYVENSPQWIIKSIQNRQVECGYLWDGRVTVLDEMGEAYIEYRDDAGGLLHFLVDMKRQGERTSVTIYSANSSKDSKVFRLLEYGAKGIHSCP